MLSESHLFIRQVVFILLKDIFQQAKIKDGALLFV